MIMLQTFLLLLLNRRPKLPRDDVESSIPQTMQLFNRMNKKTPPSGARAPSNRYIMQQQQPGGNENAYQSKKVRIIYV